MGGKRGLVGLPLHRLADPGDPGGSGRAHLVGTAGGRASGQPAAAAPWVLPGRHHAVVRFRVLFVWQSVSPAAVPAKGAGVCRVGLRTGAAATGGGHCPPGPLRWTPGAPCRASPADREWYGPDAAWFF